MATAKKSESGKYRVRIYDYTLNGKKVTDQIDPDLTLFDFLRNHNCKPGLIIHSRYSS